MAALILDKIVDLPTLGKPINPTSAIILSSTFNIFSSPGSPSSLNLGAVSVWVLKATLPRPPRPPSATTTSVISPTKSAITKLVLSSTTVVPSGTLIIISSADAPFLFWPLPFSPFFPLMIFIYRKSIKVLRPLSTWKIMLAPFPPLPPFGPPIGSHFSRRKEVQPSPPLPAITLIVSSSTNILSPILFLLLPLF